MRSLKQGSLIFILLFVLALSLRVGVARFLPNDDPYDGKVYSQIAGNLLEQHVYSHATEAPFEPSIVRLPGYPLFVAGIYAAFGEGDNTAVRIVQAIIDAMTSGLVALLAFYWEPDPNRKRSAAIAALALMAICPFTTAYVATILSETLTTFLAVAMCVTATFAFRARRQTQAALWWATTGVVAGLGVLARPDSALFAAAIGITLVLTIVFAPRKERIRDDGKYESVLRISRASYLGAVFTIAFCLVLVPWTVRNWRVFHIFQPLASAHAEMPGEFVPRGYLLWTRTWLTDERDVAPVLWSVDTMPITIEDIPDNAFDSPDERKRVATLLERYNHPQATTTPLLTPEVETPLTAPEAQAIPNQAPEASPGDEESEEEDTEEDVSGADEEAQPVAMTPAIDIAFAQLAHERIARAPFRYYVTLPLKRAVGLWFNTHSQYYPFEGELFPPEGVGHELSQQIWLPIFMALVWIYTLLAVGGAWFLWRAGDFVSRRWVLLIALVVCLRLGFFALRESPEPRYVVELFPFLIVLGGIAAVRVLESFTAER